MRDDFCLCLGPGGFHRMHVSVHGPAVAEAVFRHPAICVHGLTRNGRDFDSLAGHLAQTRRVFCPDVVGRGRSDWLTAADLYGHAQYVADMGALIARIGVSTLDWVGTSMGGLIGMTLAALPNTPIRRLVLNDVGPAVAAEALARIGTYVGEDPTFEGLAGVEAYLRRVHAPFGRLSDGQWRMMATHSFRKRADGSLGLAYDPAIGAAFRAGPIVDVDLWAVYDQVRCPVLVLRGAESDLLSRETAAQMAERGPRATVVEVPDCGHAPALLSEDQIGAVAGFLDAE